MVHKGKKAKITSNPVLFIRLDKEPLLHEFLIRESELTGKSINQLVIDKLKEKYMFNILKDCH